MSKYDKVSLIIVNWNGQDHLKKCFKSLEKVDYPNFEIIVVDNASKDNSIELIKEFTRKMRTCDVKVKTIINKKNLGFAGGNNTALPYVKGSTYSYLIMTR